MTQSFDEWMDKNHGGLFDKPHQRECFEAGAQSRQAEIDELQARVDEITNHVDINFDEDRDDDQHSYWSGYNQAIRELNDILKGKENE